MTSTLTGAAQRNGRLRLVADGQAIEIESAHGADTLTSAMHGTLRHEAQSPQEFFALTGTRT